MPESCVISRDSNITDNIVRKVTNLGPRMKPYGTSGLTGYSCKDCPFKTTQSCLWNPIELALWRRPACKTLLKTLDISSATAQVALGPLKAPFFS